MASFDKSQDKCLKEYEKHDFDGSYLQVSIMKYKDGEEKVQIVRTILTREEKEIFAKLGRLLVDELEAILPDLQDAVEFINKKQEKSSKKGKGKKSA